MSESKWTPGPWKYQYAFDGIYDVLAPNPDADKESVSYSGESLRVADIFSLEDARLIAAAPEMYEALSRARWLLAQLVAGSAPYPGWQRDYQAIFNESEAALAKATGQEVTS